MRKTYHLQIVTFGLQRAAGPYRGAITGLMQRSKKRLFNQLVGTHLKLMRNCEAEGLRSLKVDHQLVLGGRLHRQVARFFSLWDAIDNAAASRCGSTVSRHRRTLLPCPLLGKPDRRGGFNRRFLKARARSTSLGDNCARPGLAKAAAIQTIPNRQRATFLRYRCGLGCGSTPR